MENLTRIYFESGDEVVVTMGDTQGENLVLRVYNFEGKRSDHTYSLQPGENRLVIKNRGLGYIDYFTLDWGKVALVRIHIYEEIAFEKTVEDTKKQISY